MPLRPSFSALLLAYCGFLQAQAMIDPARFPARVQAILDGRKGSESLKCELTPMKPVLNFGFRFQAGYLVRVPLRQYSGPGHSWGMVAKVTPEGGDRRPVYLVSSIDLPSVPETKAEAEVGGGYLLGKGRYAIEFTLFDETDRICRKHWNTTVAPGRSDRKVKIAMLPDTVAELSLRGARAPVLKDDIHPLRITILLHAAPLFPRRTRLRAGDTLLLAGSLSALLERLPARQVRLVAFNLDQRNEVYRDDHFDPATVDTVARAMSRQELGVIDYSVLQNRKGYVDFLASLVNQELNAAQPSDVVIFFGPPSRYYWDRASQPLLDKPAGAAPQFYCFQFKPFFRRDPTLPDIIASTTSKLKGKTVMIHSPSEFAKAIDQLESRIVAGK